MSSEPDTPYISQEYWNCDVKELLRELNSFIEEFRSFTPDWFAEVKFHLLREPGLTLMTRDEFCSVSIYGKLCGNCDDLYLSKNCRLWYQLFDLIKWRSVQRAPPCIRNALRSKSIKTVANYLKKANLLSPPFYKARATPRCGNMKKWGYCSPDEYCKNMQTDNLLEYTKARQHTKMTR
ncbi:MAG: hypothetical protein ACFFEF_14525 [Candidatus Thorarchaeota archaeon]